MEALLYVFLASAYGLVGLFLSGLYYLGRRLREEPGFHALTVLVMCLATAVVLLAAPLDFERLAAFHLGAQFFLFCGASLFYVPVVVFLVLHYWERLIEHLLSPGEGPEPPSAPKTQREQWERIQTCLEALALHPNNPSSHERLADLYAGMGFIDSAVYQYSKATEWTDRGYAQGCLLYKASRLLVEKKGDATAALGLLRRLVRLYPKSYFAAYARRILSGHDAQAEARREEAAGTPPHESYSFLPPDILEEP